jgi:arylsulfatase
VSRRGVEKSGYWLLDVAKAGEYEFELRRWPKEIDRPLREGDPNGYGEIPIDRASFYISNYHHMTIAEKKPYGFEGLMKAVEPGDTAVVFTVPLEKGPIALHTWFQGKGNTLSAYYVYVKRL